MPKRNCLRFGSSSEVANKLYNHHLKICSSYLPVPISKVDDENIGEWYRGSEMDYTGIDGTEPPQVIPSPEVDFKNDDETAD
ncbi:unnamed protein product, partial [Mesorhabditis belari]|uniref:Uncharacterized protein n=1 Tax=Mesorhabditis belari TaxID=2138241 RepID=A0AAF3EWR8_9BILA